MKQQMDEVLRVARELEQQGKTPCLALLKSQLKTLPTPILIKGLQYYKSLPIPERKKLTFPPVKAAAYQEKNQNEVVKQLQQKLLKLQQDYDGLHARLEKLEQSH